VLPVDMSDDKKENSERDNNRVRRPKRDVDDDEQQAS